MRHAGPSTTDGAPPAGGASPERADAAGRRPAPRVTVVVVSYNSAAALETLLPSLDEGLAGVDARVVVVDNDSHDGSAATVARVRPEATVVPMGRNAGYAAAINAGAGLADPDDVLLVLNPDVRLRPGCVPALLEALAVPGTGIAVPRLVDPTDGSTATSLRRDPSVRRAWATAVLGGHRAETLGLGEVVREPAAYTRPHAVAWATGAVLAVAPGCRRHLGDWDESFFLYSEEVELCQRARRAGWTVRYEPSAVAEHVGGPYGSDARLWRLLVRNRVALFGRHAGPVRAAAFRAGVVTGEALRLARGALARDAAAVRTARAGLAGAVVGLDPRGPQAGAARTTTTAGAGPAASPAVDRGPTGDAGDAGPVTPGFVWFAAQDWWYHNRAHSDFQLMQQVARTRPVLLVNSLGLRLPRKGVSTNPARRILRKARSMTKLVRRPVPGLPNYHVMTPIMLPLYGDGVGARLNAWFIRQQVRAVGRVIGVGPEPVVALTIPTAWPVARHLRRSALLYNRSDLHSAFPEADGAWITGLEEALLDHADRVLYVSHELMAVDAERRPRLADRAVFLDHGVDLEHFTLDGDVPVPPELADVPRPVVGFFGGIDDYVVDVELFTRTAREVPEASLVLVGDATCDLSELLALPNVHWFGYQPYDRIPGFGRAFDVALMPWLDNEWIRFANPIKLKEYLALGLPVVTTDYPEAHHGPREHLHVAARREDFPATVRAALADRGDPAARRAAVLSATWAERARLLTTVADAVRADRRPDRPTQEA